MSLILIARALEKKLGTLTPALHIAGENGTYAQVTGTPYQAINLLPATTKTPPLSQAYSIEIGIFQVVVCYPSAQGPVNARTRAELIRAHFAPGPLPDESGQVVEILGKASVLPAVPAVGWYCIPVRIQYKAIVQP